jgi:hypothetical protein
MQDGSNENGVNEKAMFHFFTPFACAIPILTLLF